MCCGAGLYARTSVPKLSIVSVTHNNSVSAVLLSSGHGLGIENRTRTPHEGLGLG